MKENKKNTKNTIVIVLDIVLLIFLVVYAIYSFKTSKAYEIDITSFRVETDKKKFDFCIDSISKYTLGTKRYISIDGWIVEKGVDSKTLDTIKVVLKDIETGKYYAIPTTRKTRKDVTKLIYDGVMYDDSGFEVKTQFESIVNPDLHEYEIFFYMNNEEGKKIIKTDIKVNEWINNH